MDEEIIILEEETEVIDDIEIEESGSTFINSGTRHNALIDKDEPGSHTISAIDGLQKELDKIETPRVIESNICQQADYYMWEDGNPDNENRTGLFVTMHQNNDGKNVIKICRDIDTEDVFGVTVSDAGFIGNQSYIKLSDGTKIGRDGKYSLVAHSGLVTVQREENVAVGDYIVPDAFGKAKTLNDNIKYKSSGEYKCGYLVTGLSEPGGVKSAIISLTISSTIAKKISDTLYKGLDNTTYVEESDFTVGLVGRMKTAETNVATLTTSIEDVSKLVKKIQDETKEDVDNMGDKIDEMDGKVDGAVADSEAAKNNASQALIEATAIRTEAVQKANEAITSIQQIGESVKTLTYDITDYSIGEYSQIYGLTWEQAKTAIKLDNKIGCVHIPTVDHEEFYDGYEVVHLESDNVTFSDIQKFSRQYYYTWDGEKWIPSNANGVYLSSEYKEVGDQVPYWVVEDNVVFDNEFYGTNSFTKGEVWYFNGGEPKVVATLDENGFSRAVNYISKTLYETNIEVTNAKGDLVGLQTKLDAEGAKVAMVASVITEMNGKCGGVFETIEELPEAPDTNMYYCVGDKAPYDVYQWSTTNNAWIKQAGVYYDGVNFCKVNAADIIASVNALGESEAKINADRIKFNAGNYEINADKINFKAYEGLFITDENGMITSIDGNKIKTGTVTADKIEILDDEGNIIFKADNTVEDNNEKVKMAATCITGRLTADAIEVLSDEVDEDGNNIVLFKADNDTKTVEMNAANITGKITASQIDTSGLNSNRIVVEKYRDFKDNESIEEGEVIEDGETGNIIQTVEQWDEAGKDIDIVYYDTTNKYCWRYDIESGVWISGNLEGARIKTTVFLADNNTGEVIADKISSFSSNLGEITAGVIHSKDYKRMERAIWNTTSANTPEVVNEELIPDETMTLSDYTGYTMRSAGEGVAVINEEPASEGLQYTLSEDRNYYIVTGIGTCTDTNIVIPSTYGSKPVLSIGDDAFAHCYSLTSIVIPDSVTSIGEDAFSQCFNLVWVKFSNNINSIGRGAFSGCSALIKANTNPDYTTSLVIPYGVTAINNATFNGCKALTIVSIPGNVRSIGNLAFNGCSSLNFVTISDGVEFIGEDAFSNCDSLMDINIPDSVTYLGTNVFRYCDRLSSVTIGNGVTDIPSGAFWGCGYLYNITIGNNVEYIRDMAFYECTSLRNIVIGKSVRTIYGSAFYNCYNLNEIEIPENVSRINSNAFKGCNSLDKVLITNIENWCNITFVGEEANPLYNGADLYLNGVPVTDFVYNGELEEIKQYTFINCRSLKNVKLSDNVKYINKSAFKDCISLSNIIISKNLIGIDEYAFCNCTCLTSIDLGEKINTINGYAFSNCNNLTHITVPYSITNINKAAFSECTSLSEIYYKGTISDWDNIIIDKETDDNGYNNEALFKATVYYYSEEQPESEGNYWHNAQTNGVKMSFMNDNDDIIDSKFFKVSYDGSITSSSGNIGGFMINKDGMYAENIALSQDGQVIFDELLITKDASIQGNLSITGEESVLQANIVETNKISMSDNVNIIVEAPFGNNSQVKAVLTSDYWDGGSDATFECDITIKFFDSQGNPYTLIHEHSFDILIKTDIKQLWGLVKSHEDLKRTLRVPSGVSTYTYRYKKNNKCYYYVDCGFMVDTLVYNHEILFEDEGMNAGIVLNADIIPYTSGIYTIGRDRDLWKTVYCENVDNGSDRKLKDNIAQLDDNFCKDLITDLSPKSFTFKTAKTPRTRYGFIAQEVEETLNKLGYTTDDIGLVSKSHPDQPDGEDNAYTLNYINLIAPMVNVIQQLDKRVEELESELKVLKDTTQND